MDFDQPRRHVNHDGGPPPVPAEALTAERLRRWLVARDGQNLGLELTVVHTRCTRARSRFFASKIPELLAPPHLS
jgi:hypothetical protein